MSRPFLGFSLALLTAVLWGVLPIALKIVLREMTPLTITWVRFAVSTAAVGALLAAGGRLPRVSRFGRQTWRWLAIALAGLVGNYVLYLVALNHATPAITQTVIQLSPLFLIVGGVLIYGESFSGGQWVGLVTLVGGLALFFNTRLPELLHPGRGLGLGVTLLIGAAVAWTMYALVQKHLLAVLSSQQILWLLYVGATAVLFPWMHLRELRTIDVRTGGFLLFCCANTVVAYGAFAEALEHWEVSRVSAVLATAPLFTLAGGLALSRIAPSVSPAERLTPWSVTGALLVVLGSVLCAFGRRRAR